MIGVRRESTWQFVTSGGGGVTLDFFAATGGKLILQDPGNHQQQFIYGGAGIGAGFPFKIPQFGRFSPHRLNMHPYGRSVSISGAPTSFPNTGTIYILDGFPQRELQRADLVGGAIIGELNASLIGGVSASAFLLGANLASFRRAISAIGNLTVSDLDRLPPFNALLVVAGVGVAVAAGASATAYAGYVG